MLHQGGVGEILEAWYYTRAVQGWSWRPDIPPGRCRRGPRGLVLQQTAGTDVVHGVTTGWIPTAARGVDLRGAVIKYWGSVGDSSDWYTGVLVYWYTGISKAQMGS